MEIIKLKPFFAPKIWGGKQLKDFGFQIPENQKIGEAWVISAHDNGMSYLLSGEFQSQSLKTVFDQHRELFNHYQGEFPLLVKIITPNDFLSVQVHPTDDYALKKHQSLGKPESWLVLSAPADAYLIYGHHAQNQNELVQQINDGQWNQLLKKVPVAVGDFLYVAPGKIHAITPNVVVCEIQRSSDITYRFYDYNRVDETGQPRRLDLQDSLSCTQIPDDEGLIVKKAQQQIFSSDYFSVYLWDVNQNPTLELTEKPYWLQFSVIQGQGTINNQAFQMGESAISLGEITQIQATGNLQIIVSWIRI